RENEKDLADIPENLRTGMQLNFVDDMDEVLHFALERPISEAKTSFLPVPILPTAQPETEATQ
ncbi:MAG: S16 family serine protease, partial [Terriglobales bacterium]